MLNEWVSVVLNEHLPVVQASFYARDLPTQESSLTETRQMAACCYGMLPMCRDNRERGSWDYPNHPRTCLQAYARTIRNSSTRISLQHRRETLLHTFTSLKAFYGAINITIQRFTFRPERLHKPGHRCQTVWFPYLSVWKIMQSWAGPKIYEGHNIKLCSIYKSFFCYYLWCLTEFLSIKI